jgi:hypothetical protein
MIKLIGGFLLCYFTMVQAYIESGAYLNPSIGYGYVSNNTWYNPTDNTSISLGLMGGYAFNKYFAVDGGATFMPNTYKNQTTNYYLTDVAIRGSVPFSNFASAYVHVGFGALFNSSGAPNQYGLFTGLGAIFNVSKHISISIEDYGIYIPSNTRYDINILALGLAYGF